MNTDVVSNLVLAGCGGILIGVSATMLLAFNGRVAGISGITNRLFLWKRGDVAWRVCFLLGLLGPAWLLFKAQPQFFGPPVTTPSRLMFAGLLVGFGTAMGNGCTSGHGVCGISRFSVRSVVATLVFMASAMFTVWWVKNFWS